MLIAVIAPAFAAKTTPAACPNYSKNFDPSPPTMPNAKSLVISPVISTKPNVDLVDRLGLEMYLYALEDNTCANHYTLSTELDTKTECNLLNDLQAFAPKLALPTFTAMVKQLDDLSNTVKLGQVAGFFRDRPLNDDFYSRLSGYFSGSGVNQHCVKLEKIGSSCGALKLPVPASTISSSYTTDVQQYIDANASAQCFNFKWNPSSITFKPNPACAAKAPTGFPVKDTAVDPSLITQTCAQRFPAGANQDICLEVDQGFTSDSLERLKNLPAMGCSKAYLVKTFALIRGFKQGKSSDACAAYLKDYQTSQFHSFDTTPWGSDMYSTLWGCKILFSASPSNELTAIKADLEALADIWAASEGSGTTDCNTKITDPDIQTLCGLGDTFSPFISGP
ncbi:MAG: hypothetical protein HQL22_09020, partial [Candidatus Omnitrophica bacterium]|nr:hypothetical protein [Candidatus Omnitrophota bacterium]